MSTTVSLKAITTSYIVQRKSTNPYSQKTGVFIAEKAATTLALISELPHYGSIGQQWKRASRQLASVQHLLVKT